MTDARETILQRIRGALAETRTSVETMPPAPEVWPPSDDDREALAARFARELADVHGRAQRFATIEAARAWLAETIREHGWNTIGAFDAPPVRELLEGIDGTEIAYACDDWQPADVAALPLGVVAAERLLADTGSCAVACRTAAERMLCYLPPACVVVARVEQVAEHLPAAWEHLAALAADGNTRGELVIITGPSRTADIEKILILGVHGPKQLIVLLVG